MRAPAARTTLFPGVAVAPRRWSAFHVTIAVMAVASAGAFASLEDMKSDVASEREETRSAWTRRLATFSELEAAASLDDLAAGFETGDAEIAGATLAAAEARMNGLFLHLDQSTLVGLDAAERALIAPALAAARAESVAALVEAENVLASMRAGDLGGTVQASARLEKNRSASAASLVSARDHLRRLRGTDIAGVEQLGDRVQRAQAWLALWSIVLLFGTALRGRALMPAAPAMAAPAPSPSLEVVERAPAQPVRVQSFADTGLRKKGAA